MPSRTLERTAALIAITLGTTLTGVASAAGPVPPDSSVHSTSPAFTDGWGTSIAQGDGFIVVGAPNDDTSSLNAGSVSVIWLDPVTGAPTASVIEIPAGLSSGAAFGYRVGAYQNKFVVAAPAQDGAGGPVGAAYVYEVGLSTVVLEETLQPTFLLPSNLFAQDVDIHENRVIVGAPGGGLQGSGAVWVFDHSGGDDWSGGNELSPLSGDEGDGLGWAVAFDQNDKHRFAASAPFDNVGMTVEAGSIRIFEYDTMAASWNNVDTLDLSMMGAGAATFHLGNDLDFDGPNLIAGEFEYGPTGRAHLFHDAAPWSYGQTLSPDGSANVLKFGRAVSLHDDFAAVGAMHSDFGLALEGASYLYHDSTTGWNQTAELMSNGGTAGIMGAAVDLSENGLLVGAPGATETTAAPVICHGNVQFWSTDHTPGCASDADMDGDTDADDIASILAAWGPCADPAGCPEDVNDDGSIDMLDLIDLLLNWGSCF
jgi:hypothetical protein